jgi:hypothetical protein
VRGVRANTTVKRPYDGNHPSGALSIPAEPALKRRAIVSRPYGTGTQRSTLENA